MNRNTALVLAVVLFGFMQPRKTEAAAVSFDGNVFKSLAPPGDEMTARLGSFNPAFDPNSYKFVYGIDSAGNMASPNYSRAVSDGNFRPIGEGSFSGNLFSGTGDASGIAGQRLWIFLFNTSNPDAAQGFALFTGTSDVWRAPDDSGTLHISADLANVFVFGAGGNGSPIKLQGLPIPEPASLTLLLSGVVFLSACGRLGQRVSSPNNGMHRSPRAGHTGNQAGTMAR